MAVVEVVVGSRTSRPRPYLPAPASKAATASVRRVGGPGPRRFPSLRHSTSSGHFTHLFSGPPSPFFARRTGKGPAVQSDVLASSFDGCSGLAVEQGGLLWGEQV